MTYSLLIDTPRLTIVGINEINMSELVEYLQSNHQHLKYGGGFVPYTKEEIRAVYDNWTMSIKHGDDVRFFIVKDERLIGIISISNIIRGAFHAAYIGYHIAKHQQNKGYMTEALTGVIEFAFEALNLHRLMANYRPENAASARVLQKLNFQKEGFAKDYLLVNGSWSDHVLTSLTNPHWRP